MKKVLSLLLVLCIAIGIFSVTATAADDVVADAAMAKLQKLDVDSNGSISTADASMYLKAAAGIIDTSEADYDFDADGSVSVLDAQKVLRVVAGVDSALTQEEALALFNKGINSVKTVRPGFEKTSTVVCPSIKVTTMNAPIDQMNVTNLEFSQYVDKIIKLMNTFPYNLALDAEMKAQLEQMRVEASESYKPQVSTKTVAKASNSHYTYFPVNNLGWSSRLTLADIKSISCTIENGNIVYVLKMNDVTYVGDEYPTGASGFSKRQALPYGKIFNIPSFDESDGSIVNKVSFSNGTVVYKQDYLTGSSLYADYSYSYVIDITAAPQKDSTLVMKTVTTTNTNENFVMNKVN